MNIIYNYLNIYVHHNNVLKLLKVIIDVKYNKYFKKMHFCDDSKFPSYICCSKKVIYI